MNITETRKLLTKMDRLLAPGEVLCIRRRSLADRRNKKKGEQVPLFALVPWDMFEQMLEISITVEDKLQMLEFAKFMKDNSKTHIFTDLFKKFYTQQGYYDEE